MAEKRMYDFPGGVCPICEHTPLNVETSTNDNGETFVWFVCSNPECGHREMLPQSKNKDASTRSNKLQREWASRVKERVGNACFICGETQNVDAHHLISASRIPSLQTKVTNGIPLCRRCHKLVHDNTERWPEKYK